MQITKKVIMIIMSVASLFPSDSNNLELSKNCQLSEGIKGHASAHARTHGTNPAY